MALKTREGLHCQEKKKEETIIHATRIPCLVLKIQKEPTYRNETYNRNRHKKPSICQNPPENE